MEFTRKKRGCNYTPSEKTTLLELIEKYHHIIECKETKGPDLLRKRQAWDEITRRFNAFSSSGIRSWQQLRHLYENIKQRAKRKNEKKERMDAGEKTAKFNECDRLIFSIIEKDTSRDSLDVSVSENSEHETKPETHSDNKLPLETPKFTRTKNSILQHMTSMDDVCELVQLKKKKAEVEIELMKEKLEIARREKYKLDLELLKMERDLGIAQLSSFTAPYSPY